MVYVWSIKIEGIPANIKHYDLADLLRIPAKCIVIPVHQQRGRVWFAWLNGFKNEKYANEFAARWNGASLHKSTEIGIICKVRHYWIPSDEPRSVPLTIIQDLCDITVHSGEDATLTFSCEGYPRPYVTWLFNHVELKASMKHKMTYKKNMFVLTIKICNATDVGTYHVYADNGICQLEGGAMLNIVDRPCELDVKNGTVHESLSQIVLDIKSLHTDAKTSCVIGQNTELVWKVASTERPEMKWLFNGEILELETSNRFKVIEKDDGIWVLNILQVELTDSGIYTARAINKFSEIEAQLTLYVNGIEPMIKSDLKMQLQIIKDQTLVLQLVATGIPTPELVWMRDDHEIVTTDRFIMTSSTDNSEIIYALTISNIQLEDQGKYSARIQNIAGSLNSKNCEVIVMIPPSITQSMCEMNVLKGQNASLILRCDGRPRPKITWFFNNRRIEASEKYEMASMEDLFVLTVIESTIEDAGAYRAVIYNDLGETEETAKIDVRMKPEIVGSESVNEVSCLFGQDIEIKWKFSGFEKPWIAWNFNDVPLILGDRIQLIEGSDGESTLKIGKAMFSDSGSYVVRATNSVGEVEAKTTLNIVSTRPKILSDLKPQLRILAGASMTLRLNISGSPSPKVQWLQGNSEITIIDDARVKIFSDDLNGIHALTIFEMKLEDEAEYWATIENIDGSIHSHKCQIFIIVNPELLKSIHKTLTNMSTNTSDIFPDSSTNMVTTIQAEAAGAIRVPSNVTMPKSEIYLPSSTNGPSSDVQFIVMSQANGRLVFTPIIHKPYDINSYGVYQVTIYDEIQHRILIEINVHVIPDIRICMPRQFIVKDATNTHLADGRLTLKGNDGRVQFYKITNETGYVDIPDSLPAGTYDVEIDSHNWELQKLKFKMILYQDIRPQTNIQTIAFNVKKQYAMKLVLKWDGTPQDLDAHVFASNGKHIYFHNKTEGEISVLDYNYKDGCGFETVAINPQPSVKYVYAVYKYSKNSELTESDTLLEIHRKDASTFQKIIMPKQHQPQANVWVICVIDGSTGNVTPINKFEEYDYHGSNTIGRKYFNV